MGISNDANLAVGWEVGYDDVVKFVKDNNVGSCSNTYQCMCTTCCWDLSKFPENVIIVKGSPYYDAPQEEYNYYISLFVEINKTHGYAKIPSSVSEVLKITTDSKKYNNILQFVSKLTGEEISNIKEPKFYAIVDIT